MSIDFIISPLPSTFLEMRDSIVGGGILGTGRMTTGLATAAVTLTLGCTLSQIAIDVSFTADPLTT